ncbi:hypothetical protein [Caedibacter taeniospiralis]|uniref:hypothetical protein n=1 Tax=Caedibacter taeniospiralis TaxID=28907 RepID=UPI0037BF7943
MNILRTVQLEVFKPYYSSNKIDYYAVNIAEDQDSGKLQGMLMMHSKDRYLTQNQAIVDEINAFIKQQHIENTFAIMNQFSSWFGDYDINFFVYGSDTSITETARSITESLRNEKMFTIVNNSESRLQKQFRFDIDEIKARRLGIVIVGGLIVGTIFSLFIVPLVYLIFKGQRRAIAQIKY